MDFLNWLRVIVLGIVEGITEWLPISSTSHLMVIGELWKGDPAVFTEGFRKMFDVVIQLGAILAVVTVFFYKLNPFSAYKSEQQKKNTRALWVKILIATVPAVILGLIFDDLIDRYLASNFYVIGAMLILYGAAFLVVETFFMKNDPTIMRYSRLSYLTALYIGCAQVLALIPGTSRSGVTIIAALLLGCSRYLAVEFSFFMAIPVMLGASLLKFVKYIFLDHMELTGLQVGVIFLAAGVAYLVSLVVIRSILYYIKRHDFKPFGIYRIVAGIAVILLAIFLFSSPKDADRPDEGAEEASVVYVIGEAR
ncbi:MAG: undecaprenyl-diphosphate phosphatase [Lachnospiraceae bacterium]|nr:undecaprenyl-diphosphate phosphatase [Lachnospiraceae bacterium]MBP5255307.1 undecaprenyl-diphosphate phosphatase [Lachnospiraceae bacterium]